MTGVAQLENQRGIPPSRVRAEPRKIRTISPNGPWCVLVGGHRNPGKAPVSFYRSSWLSATTATWKEPSRSSTAGRSSHLTHDGQKKVTRCNRRPGPYVTVRDAVASARETATVLPGWFFSPPLRLTIFNCEGY